MLLGAIIDPDIYLVYTTSVATLVTFVTTKYRAFNKITAEGYEVIKAMVYDLFMKQTKAIAGNLLNEVKSYAATGGELLGTDNLVESAISGAKDLGLDVEITKLKERASSAISNPENLLDEGS